MSTVPPSPRTGRQQRGGKPGKVGEIFNKTKMCTFHLLHMCNKGSNCNFAHSQEELQPLPDLSCTKLCPELVGRGQCEDENCRYAHNRFERRELSSESMAKKHNLPADLTYLRMTQVACFYTHPFPEQLLQQQPWMITDTFPAIQDIQDSNSVVGPGASSDTSECLQQGEVDPDGVSGISCLPQDAAEDQPVPGQVVSEDLESTRESAKDTASKNKFLKTKMCSFHLMGKCRKRTDCNFAHSFEELQGPMDQLRPKMISLQGDARLQPMEVSTVESPGSQRNNSDARTRKAKNSRVNGTTPKKETASISDVCENQQSSSRPASPALVAHSCGFGFPVPRPPVSADFQTNIHDNPLPPLACDDLFSATKPERVKPERVARPPVLQDPVRDQVARKKFFKTKFCKFHASGRCRKRLGCNFAHDDQEMHALPNLFRTKLCPNLINKGTCETLNCRYAHEQAELRNSEEDHLHQTNTENQILLDAPDTPTSPMPVWKGLAEFNNLGAEKEKWIHQPIMHYKIDLEQFSASPSTTTAAPATPGVISPSLSFEDSQKMFQGNSVMETPRVADDVSSADREVGQDNYYLYASQTERQSLGHMLTFPPDDCFDDGFAAKARAEFAATQCSKEAAYLLPSPLAAVRVKNTFLDVDASDVEVSARIGLRSIRSAPDLNSPNLTHAGFEGLLADSAAIRTDSFCCEDFDMYAQV